MLIQKTVLGFNFAFQKPCTVCVCVSVKTVLLCVKKQIFIFRPQSSSDDFLSSLPPSLSLASVSFSPPSLCSLPLFLCPSSLLDRWSKHRKRAGSVPPRQSWGWAFLQSSCAGVKSLLWFSFHLSSANHSATLQCLNSDPCKEFHSKEGLTPVSQLALPSHLSSYYSFSFLSTGQYHALTEALGETHSRNEEEPNWCFKALTEMHF